MTLTLDDVRNKQFRMARKAGYEVLQVDEFVDEVRERFAQLLEDNQNLEKQIEYVLSESNRDELDQIRRNGQALVQEQHKTSDRARFIDAVCAA